MKKLSQMMESVWSDIQDRSAGETFRKEDIGKKIIIDGVNYNLTKEFWDKGDQFNEDSSEEWTCFAFNKPDKNPNVILGDTDGAFGRDMYDLGSEAYEYDVYVLRDYLEVPVQEQVKTLVYHGGIPGVNIPEIRDILEKYIEKIYSENHMSDAAAFRIYETHGGISNTIISIGTNNTKIPECIDDYDDYYERQDDVEDIHEMIYPGIDGWFENLESELIEAYTKLGWEQLKGYETDPYDDISALGLCFVKWK